MKHKTAKNPVVRGSKFTFLSKYVGRTAVIPEIDKEQVNRVRSALFAYLKRNGLTANTAYSKANKELKVSVFKQEVNSKKEQNTRGD